MFVCDIIVSLDGHTTRSVGSGDHFSLNFSSWAENPQGTLISREPYIGALAVKLIEEELKEIEDAVPQDEVSGDRYVQFHLASAWMYNNSPPLSSWTETQR